MEIGSSQGVFRVVSEETLVTDQCMTQALTCRSQTRALSQASECVSGEGRVLRVQGGVTPAGSAVMN